MIEFANQTFKTQKMAGDFVRQLLTGEVGNRITPEHPKFSALLSLIQRHPERALKVGAGVAAFRVRTNPFNPNALAFDIERTDGSMVDISWLKCITAKQTTPMQNLMAAMRHAIKQQINTFRRSAMSNPACAVCGENVKDGGHIDHVLPFQDLATMFLRNRDDVPTQFDDCDETFVAIFRASDQAFGAAWEHYHEQVAILRLTCARCNLTRPKGL